MVVRSNGTLKLPQVSKEEFTKALAELGHDPEQYEGQRLTLSSMSELYELDQDAIIEAIDQRQVIAHYDYSQDTIWVDALEAAHFYYCVMSESPMLGNY